MLRKLLALVGMAVLAALLAPASAQGQQAGAGVIVFTGDAQTSPLCFPGDPLDACGNFGGITDDAGTWEFTVPGSDIVLPGGGTLPATCNAAGAFVTGGGNSVALPSGDPGNCTINANGELLPALGAAGPGCGVSNGFTVDDPGDPNDNRFTIAAAVGSGIAGDIVTEWISSAGGTLPITGTLDVDGGPDVTYAGVVQARPIPQGGGVPCLTEPATTFTVVGVVAGAGAA